MNLLVILLSFSSFLYAQADNDPLMLKRATYQINRDYVSGAYLIYDCKGKYYACVNEESYGLCKIKRDESKYENKQYACAPLKKFPDIETCKTTNYEVMESAAFKRFCYPK